MDEKGTDWWGTAWGILLSKSASLKNTFFIKLRKRFSLIQCEPSQSVHKLSLQLLKVHWSRAHSGDDRLFNPGHISF